MKLLLFVLIGSITAIQFNTCKRQQQNAEYLEWSSKRKLNWGDFESMKSTPQALGAESFITLSFNYKFNNKNGYLQKFSVTSLFSKRQSWYNVELNYVLKHEQDHFNIGEVVARKFRERLFKIRRDKEYVTESKLRELYGEYKEMLVSMQVEYDKDTENGRNRYHQRKWSERIEVELQALGEFKKKNY